MIEEIESNTNHVFKVHVIPYRHKYGYLSKLTMTVALICLIASICFFAQYKCSFPIIKLPSFIISVITSTQTTLFNNLINISTITSIPSLNLSETIQHALSSTTNNIKATLNSTYNLTDLNISNQHCHYINTKHNNYNQCYIFINKLNHKYFNFC